MTTTTIKRDLEDKMTAATLGYWNGCDEGIVDEILGICVDEGIDEALDQLAALAFDYEAIGQAEPTNYAADDGQTRVEWVEAAKLPSGRECFVYYRFSEDEEAAAGDEASNLPFDEEHIDRIKLSGER